MAVWMVGQPARGLLLERSLAQLLGTVLGAAAGAALVLPWLGIPAASILGLVAWIAICCGIANTMRHQRAYGAALCGLTSAVIVSLTLGTHDDPVGFAAARAMDNVIGISIRLGERTTRSRRGKPPGSVGSLNWLRTTSRGTLPYSLRREQAAVGHLRLQRQNGIVT
jgi:hypothetical protein